MYGLGLMEIKFEKFFFLLKFMPKLQGHLGILGVHAWYNKDSKDIYVLNVGSTKDMVKSFQYLINVINIVEKEKKQLVK
jgi:D-alanyl-D-alanine carboxypeptidase